MGVDTKWLAKQQETRMSDTTVTITSETFEYMADRIEELEADLRYANKRIEHAFERNDRQAQTIDNLTTKLAKAVEALEKLDVGEGWAAQIARTTIAELTGGKDE